MTIRGETEAPTEQASLDGSTWAPGTWRWRALSLSILLAACAYLLFALWGGWQDVVDAVRRIGLFWLGAVLAMSLINYALRFVRWEIYLRQLGHRIKLPESGKIYIAGFALTTTPGKVGEALRCLLLKPHGVPWSHSLAALFSERLSDLVAIIALALVGLSIKPELMPALIFVGVGTLLAYLLMQLSSVPQKMGAWCRSGSGKLRKLIGQICDVALQAATCNRPLLIIAALLISIVAWGAEALAFGWILDRLDAELSLQIAVFIYAAGMLGGAISLMPGGLGGAEATMTGLLIWADVPVADAVAATLVCRLATLWFAVGLGFLSTLMIRQLPAMRPEPDLGAR